MPRKEKIEIRDLKNGSWYWVHKAVIQRYASKVGAIGVLVYNFLASLADSQQACFPSQKYIADRLGYSRAYVNETLKLLEKNRLIKIEKRGRCRRVYHLIKVRRQPGQTEVSTITNSCVNQGDNNDNKLTRIINNIDGKNLSRSNSKTFKNFKPRTREELLAFDLADALRDRKGISLYLSYAKKYPESFLRRVLGEVKEIPDHKIKKSRGALFNHLIQKYAEKASENHRN